MSHFQNMIKMELSGINSNADISSAMPDELKDAKRIVWDKFRAALMLNGANGSRHNDLKQSMAENYVMGTSEYPESPEIVLCILTVYQLPTWSTNKRRGKMRGQDLKKG